MRNISIRIRGIVSGLDILLVLLLDIGLGELDEFLTFSIHPRVVLITIFVAIFTLDMWSPCIEEDTSCIFYFFILLILNLLRLSLTRFFPSQASLLHCYGYLEEVALYLASLTCSLQV
jgi:succinate-acetate transporter protein